MRTSVLCADMTHEVLLNGVYRLALHNTYILTLFINTCNLQGTFTHEATSPSNCTVWS